MSPKLGHGFWLFRGYRTKGTRAAWWAGCAFSPVGLGLQKNEFSVKVAEAGVAVIRNLHSWMQRGIYSLWGVFFCKSTSLKKKITKYWCATEVVWFKIVSVCKEEGGCVVRAAHEAGVTRSLSNFVFGGFWSQLESDERQSDETKTTVGSKQFPILYLYLATKDGISETWAKRVKSSDTSLRNMRNLFIFSSFKSRCSI